MNRLDFDLAFEEPGIDTTQTLWRVTGLRSDEEPMRCTIWFLSETGAKAEAERLVGLGAKSVTVHQYERKEPKP